MLTASLNIDVRHSLTQQFLESSAIFVRRARSIEEDADAIESEHAHCEHKGLVCATIMQCVAALETEAHEICAHGPGAHLGSNGTNAAAKAFLTPIADLVDEQSAVTRYDLMLHLLRKPALDKSARPHQDVTLLVRLRNELVHYKSRWGSDMTGAKLRAALEGLRHVAPPWMGPGYAFFPHRCLSAGCGAWALESVIRFLDDFYGVLGISSQVDRYRARLVL